MTVPSGLDQASYLGEEFPLQELLARFRDIWADKRDSSETPVTRIASFNLLVVSRDQDLHTLGTVLTGLKDSHPARVIWVRIDPSLSWEDSTARLHLACRVGGQQVCGEHIQIKCCDQPERVASIVMPLTRAGLPTHLLWWRAGQTKGPLFERLGDRSRLILLVRDEWETLRESLPALWEDPTLQEHSFIPLAWFQLQSARQQIAAAYATSDLELKFPSALHAAPFRDLLSAWLHTAFETRPGKVNLDQVGIRLSYDQPQDQVTLAWDSQVKELELQSPLSAVRAALNQTHRDPVFARIMKLWKE